MKVIQYLGPEVMCGVPWGDEFATRIEEARASESLHHATDVVRLALHVIPDIVFSVSGVTFEELEPGGLSLPVPRDQVPTSLKRVNLLDQYTNNEGLQLALVRISEKDRQKGKVAASLCGVTFGDYAYGSTLAIADCIAAMPGHRARARGTQALEDMLARKVLGLTDIQPWGEEDHYDYGLSED